MEKIGWLGLWPLKDSPPPIVREPYLSTSSCNVSTPYSVLDRTTSWPSSSIAEVKTPLSFTC